MQQAVKASENALDILRAGLGRIAWSAHVLRATAVRALKEAEQAHDGARITEAALALGQIDTIRATVLLTKDSEAPPPQRRLREEREHTLRTLPHRPPPVKIP